MKMTIFYSKLLPDYGDLDNDTGQRPGYRVYIREREGGIGLQMVHANRDPITEEGSAVFLNVDEAQEMLQDLEEAIKRARTRSARHRSRGVDC
jgi:hypothetical protein